MLFKKLSICLLMLTSMSSVAEQPMTGTSPDKALAPSTTPSAATEKDANIINEAAIKLKIISHIPRIEIFSISKSAIPSLYEIDTNGGMIYMTDDGNYFVEGDLYTFTDTSIKNLTEEKIDKKRAAELAKLDPKEMIIFSPPKDKIKATITVFTDIDCGYCRKLHSGMKEMNDLGIEVRYMAFPRAGLGSSSYNKFVSAWCADNKQEALTKAKAGEDIPVKTCDNPVAKQFQIGNAMGVHGTPGIILSDGRLLPGYAPPVELAKVIGIIKEAPSSNLSTPTP